MTARPVQIELEAQDVVLRTEFERAHGMTPRQAAKAVRLLRHMEATLAQAQVG
jgi:methylphosphotriester-DNA--protein-cysteine methyltransferase